MKTVDTSVAKEQRAFPIVITGHVDHGKSTLIGRLLYDTGTLQDERYQEMRQSSSNVGRADEFAFVLDAFEEERQRGVTIDTAQIYFNSAIRPYVIIDAPGHREFIRNMITGASYAETAILIVDAIEGVREQTRRHAWLLSMVGIRDICVAINKLDAVDYARERYTALCSDIQRLFEEFAIVPYAIVPISALQGENIASRSSRMPWYFGPCLLEIIDSFASKPLEERPFRFPLQDVYDLGGSSVAVGRIEAGSVRTGDQLRLLPDDVTVTVSALPHYPHASSGCAQYGETAGIRLEAPSPLLRRGLILASGDLPMVASRFRATLFWFHDTFYSGQHVIIRCTTQEVPAIIELNRVFDPGAADSLEQTADRIGIGEVSRCTITTERPLVFDYCSDVPELGRYVVERDGIPVGAGIFR